MPSSIRATVRQLANTYPLSRLRSVEERVGIAAFALMFLFAAVQPLFAHEFKAGDLVLDHPWSRATPAGAKVGAGYVTIRNNGTAPDRLVAVSSEIAEKTEIHEMAIDPAGIMTMRPLADGLALAAGATTELKPGSYHIMFMGLKQPAKEGEKIAATLSFEKAGDVAVEFDVEAMGKMPAAHGG